MDLSPSSRKSQDTVSSVPLPGDAARPLLLFGPVFESQDPVSFVAAVEVARTPGGRIQPGLDMLLPAWSLGHPSDLQMLGPGPANPWPAGASYLDVYLGISADCEGLRESTSQLCLPRIRRG